MKKRISSILLVLCMVLTMFPTPAFAAKDTTTTEAASAADSGSLAACIHTKHDDQCGYSEAVEGAPCSDLQENNTYSCAPETREEKVEIGRGKADKAESDKAESDKAESDEAESDEADTVPDEEEYICDHSDGCGYTEAEAGTECTHQCGELCDPSSVPPTEEDDIPPQRRIFRVQKSAAAR